MHDLVESAIQAAGGFDQWQQVNRISCSFSPSGPSLLQRGPVGEAASRLPMLATIHTREQKVTFEPYIVEGHRGTYEPHRTAIHLADGTLSEELDDPRGSLKAMQPGTPWSAPQLLYFFGYSLWLYFTLPFNFLKEGIHVEEVAPLIEDGDTWRGLKVTYPADFPAHATEQTHYFDVNGLMRRQDYTVDVRQGLSAAHYLIDYRTFDGFAFPTKRRIYARDGDGTPLRDRLLIAADLENYQVLRDAG